MSGQCPTENKKNGTEKDAAKGSASKKEEKDKRRALPQNVGSSAPAAIQEDFEPQPSTSTAHLMPDGVNSIPRQSRKITPNLIARVHPLDRNTRNHQMSRKMAAMRRRNETVDPKKLTLFDLIFYNPPNNPMVCEDDEKVYDLVPEEETDENGDAEPENAAPVPQLKVGPNGEIMIDEKSFVIKPTSLRKTNGQSGDTSKGGECSVTGGQNSSNDEERPSTSFASPSSIGQGTSSGLFNPYRRARRTADWSNAETLRFFRAIATVGTDFSLMGELFPGRTRKDLKTKFKKEERTNQALIEKAIRSPADWDLARLIEEFTAEREEETRKEEEKRELLKQGKQKKEARKRSLKEICLTHGKKAIKAVKSAAAAVTPPALSDDLEIETSTEESLALALAAKRRKKQISKVDTPMELKELVAETDSTYQMPLRSKGRTESIVPSKSAKQVQLTDLGDSEETEESTDELFIPPAVEVGSLIIYSEKDPISSERKLKPYIKESERKLRPIMLSDQVLESILDFMNHNNPVVASQNTPDKETEVPPPLAPSSPSPQPSPSKRAEPTKCIESESDIDAPSTSGLKY